MHHMRCVHHLRSLHVHHRLWGEGRRSPRRCGGRCCRCGRCRCCRRSLNGFGRSRCGRVCSRRSSAWVRRLWVHNLRNRRRGCCRRLRGGPLGHGSHKRCLCPLRTGGASALCPLHNWRSSCTRRRHGHSCGSGCCGGPRDRLLLGASAHLATHLDDLGLRHHHVGPGPSGEGHVAEHVVGVPQDAQLARGASDVAGHDGWVVAVVPAVDLDFTIDRDVWAKNDLPVDLELLAGFQRGHSKRHGLFEVVKRLVAAAVKLHDGLASTRCQYQREVAADDVCITT
mmetsp:Transcript_11409/g.29929  ORF Transcript_11409/g.29929 Transcript_11409/m.29929 type:complete len:283 (+) Transcript_11409:176-1024(+)